MFIYKNNIRQCPFKEDKYTGCYNNYMNINHFNSF